MESCVDQMTSARQEAFISRPSRRSQPSSEILPGHNVDEAWGRETGTTDNDAASLLITLKRGDDILSSNCHVQTQFDEGLH